ncbi:restriction endonuclease [Micromonospora purpureochromogenes]|uniref:restriction endonuclease n=1 Tax=Micromonospora purpureochromogenes TaxID=47872 RepID=UPI003644DE50
MTEPLRQPIDSWKAAESNAAAWMRSWGFGDARVTQGGADAGVDVRSRGALAQVKFEASQVGRPVLQRLVGARGRNVDQDLFFFSGAGFSAQAVEYANEMEIRLFKYSLTGAMTPVNRSARAFLRALPGAAEREAAERARTAAERAAVERAAAERRAERRALEERAAAEERQQAAARAETRAAQQRVAEARAAEARAARERAAAERAVVLTRFATALRGVEAKRAAELTRFATALRGVEAKRAAEEEAERQRVVPGVKRVLSGLGLFLITLCSWAAGGPRIHDVVRGAAALSYILFVWGLYAGMSEPPRTPGVRRFFIGVALLVASICSWVFGGPLVRDLVTADGIAAAVVLSVVLMAWGVIGA